MSATDRTLALSEELTEAIKAKATADAALAAHAKTIDVEIEKVRTKHAVKTSTLTSAADNATKLVSAKLAAVTRATGVPSPGSSSGRVKGKRGTAKSAKDLGISESDLIAFIESVEEEKQPTRATIAEHFGIAEEDRDGLTIILNGLIDDDRIERKGSARGTFYVKALSSVAA